jgi:oxygen-dependent protoporphyrinogen oxidase
VNSKKIAIIGGGISGLTLAYYFNKVHPNYTVHLFEKKQVFGGNIASTPYQNRLICMGPKTVALKKDSQLYQLIQALRLQQAIITPSVQAKKRYIVTDQTLHPLPTCMIDCLKSSFRGALWEILKEPWRKKGESQETVGAFFLRRFGPHVVQKIIDPLMKGIYAGGIDHIPVDYAFKALKNYEAEYGSVLIGFLRSKKNPRTIFSFEQGLFHLIDSLKNAIHGEFFLGEPVESIVAGQNHVQVQTTSRALFFDHAILACDPASAIGLIPSIAPFFQDGYWQSITQVYIEFDEHFSLDGFGCLIPSSEQSIILGILFDSVIFPKKGFAGTALTVMIEGVVDQQQAKIMALQTLQTLLKIEKAPSYVQVNHYENAIYAPPLDYQSIKDQLDRHLDQHHPRTHLLGGFFQGVGVADQIENSYNFVKSFSSV